jgi:hypothetical protein
MPTAPLGAAVAGGIDGLQRAANFDDDAGAQAEPCENSVAEAAFRVTYVNPKPNRSLAAPWKALWT